MARIVLACVGLLAAVSFAHADQTCTIVGNSIITPFGAAPGDAYRLAMPCRYQLVDYRYDVPETQIGCRPRIFATGYRKGGVFFVDSFDVRLSILDLNDPDKLDDYVAVKAFGRNKKGTFDTTLLVRENVFNFRVDKWVKTNDISLLEDIFPGTEYSFDTDANGRVTFHVAACGLRIEFDPLQVAAEDASDANVGLTLTIPSDEDIYDYFDRDHSACFESCLTAGEKAKALGARSATDLMTFSVAQHWRKNPGHLYSSYAFCEDMQSGIRACPNDKKGAALRNCLFLLTDKEYLACASNDEDTSDAISVFNTCIDQFCYGAGCAGRRLKDGCPVPAYDEC